MTLLNNATEAIQIGLEDFKSTDPRRASSALRNIFAGTLLLFKEKLSRLSPDDNSILIQQTIIPSLDDAGVLFFKGKGHKTVDVAQIKERFKNLGINTVKWNIFDEVNNLRNNVEHFYTEHEPTLVNEIVSKLFKIIRDFCIEQLHEEPAQLFGVESWKIFLETDEIYQSEKDVSNKSLAEVDWKFDTVREAILHIRCTICHSDLIHVQSDKEYEPGNALTLLCKKCLSKFDIEEVLEDCIIEELAAECYIAAMDGGEDSYAECPECSKDTYIYEEMCCVNCGYQQPDIRCSVCHTPLDLEESYEGYLCSYHRYSMEKNQ